MLQIFFAFLALGCTAFGGPIAHIGYFQSTFVEKKRWISSQAFSDLVAICHVLPGPSSSQVGLGIGFMRGGIAGALAAWVGFTLPSALILFAVALGTLSMPQNMLIEAGRGLGWVVSAVVAKALWDMGRSRIHNVKDVILVLLCAVLAFCVPGFLGQMCVLIVGAAWGGALLKPANMAASVEMPHKPRSWRWLIIWLVTFLALPLVVAVYHNDLLQLCDRFFRTGSLVFGGGHVVLPLLKAEWVDAGLIGHEAFVAGYGAAQAVPGPLFTISAYLGAVLLPHEPLVGASLALIAMFLPSMLLVFGILPYAGIMRRSARLSCVLSGVNLSVIGLLLSAWWHPVLSSAVFSWGDVAAVALVSGLVSRGWVPIPLLILAASGIGVMFPF